MSDLIRVNTSLSKADNAIQVANKLLAANNDLPELIPYRKGDKWGFCDRNRKIVIDCIYDDAKIGNANVLPVKSNGKWGFITLAQQKKVILNFMGYDSTSRQRRHFGKRIHF